MLPGCSRFPLLSSLCPESLEKLDIQSSGRNLLFPSLCFFFHPVLFRFLFDRQMYITSPSLRYVTNPPPPFHVSESSALFSLLGPYSRIGLKTEPRVYDTRFIQTIFPVFFRQNQMIGSVVIMGRDEALTKL
jgi:hypothetical protein